MFENKKTRGFTLIELMVVVTITGIIMAAGIIAFTNAQRNSRDSKRKADVDAISKVMEQYFQINRVYPLSPYPAAIGSYFPAGYIPTTPNGGSYTITSTASTYCICDKLDKPATGNATSLGSGGTCAYVLQANVGTGDYICTSQRQ